MFSCSACTARAISALGFKDLTAAITAWVNPRVQDAPAHCTSLCNASVYCMYSILVGY